MGAFFLIAGEAGPEATAIRARARAHFAEAGFAAPAAFDRPGWQLDCYGKIGGPGPQVLDLPGGGALACVGTLINRSTAGVNALRALAAAPDWEAAIAECQGHFVLLKDRAGVLEIHRDPCAATEIFHDRAGLGVFSTSLLAVARALPARQVDPEGVFEYAFNGVTLGETTVFSEIRRLGLFESVRVEGGAAVIATRRRALLPAAEAGGDAEVLARGMLARLQGNLAAAAEAFGGTMTLALSAGYDTRLLLAVCRSIGRLPRLFVYGPDDDEDVVIAKRIAAAEGLALEHRNKGHALQNVKPEEFPAITRANWLDYDGMGLYGCLTSRAEHSARLDRHRDGALNLHGGGGEVLRNFFGLPDWPTSTTMIVRAFFSQFDPRVCRARFSRVGYEARLGAKMADVLGIAGPDLSRHQAEALYPHFRCRSWFGRDNGINLRYGHSLLAFYAHDVVEAALAVPIRLKRSGNFQARIIRLADPRLAAYPSGYGYSFDADVPWRQAARDSLMAWRPGLLRRSNYVLRQRLRPPVAKAGLLADAFVGRILDLKFPVLSELFHMQRVQDPDLYARLCSLEYMFGALGVSAIAAEG